MDETLGLLVAEPRGDATVQDALEATGEFEVTRGTTHSEVVSNLGPDVDCVVSVFEFPESDGFELLERVRERAPAVPFVLVARDGSERLASRAFEQGVDDYVPAGALDDETIAQRIRSHAEQSRQKHTGDVSVRTPEQSQKLLDAISATFPDSLYIYSDSGEYLDAILGWRRREINTRESLIGERVDDVLSEETAEKFQTAIDRTLETGELQLIEYTIPADETTYSFEGAITVIPGGYRGEQAVLCAARDITERKQRERELRETTERLERKNDRLNQFASIVSHDLRNPLNVAKGRVEMIASESDDEHVESVQRALSRMETIIEDMLTLTRVGQTIEEPQELVLDDVVTVAWENVQAAASDLECRLEQTTVEGDHNRLLHVFENLFRNALDHNDPPLTIRVGPLDGAEGFYVEDTGSGIPEDERESVFEHGYTTSQDGTGYGLAIVQDIVAAHDWTITATENDEGGARFEVVTA
jgi:PAS domain S-box-containing protein